MKRFWTEAGVAQEPGGYGVRLDGKPLRIPAGPPLLVPTLALAEAVAAEWQQEAAGGQDGAGKQGIDYSLVPLTRLAGTAQIRIVPDPAASAAAIAAYGESDLLCYRAGAPPALVARQDKAWSPWLDWARHELGAALAVTNGIIHVRQHPAALQALHRAVEAQGAWRLAALGIIVPALGSVVLGLAVAQGALDVSSAHGLSMLDEEFQADLWGEDAEAAARRAHIESDLLNAARFMGLVR